MFNIPFLPKLTLQFSSKSSFKMLLRNIRFKGLMTTWSIGCNNVVTFDGKNSMNKKHRLFLKLFYLDAMVYYHNTAFLVSKIKLDWKNKFFKKPLPKYFLMNPYRVAFYTLLSFVLMISIETKNSKTCLYVLLYLFIYILFYIYFIISRTVGMPILYEFAYLEKLSLFLNISSLSSKFKTARYF